MSRKCVSHRENSFETIVRFELDGRCDFVKIAVPESYSKEC